MKRGIALVWSVLLMAILTIISASIATYIIKESRNAVDIQNSSQAYAMARTGVEWGLAQENNVATTFSANDYAKGYSISVKVEKQNGTKTITSTASKAGSQRTLEFISVDRPGNNLRSHPSYSSMTNLDGWRITNLGSDQSFKMSYSFWANFVSHNSDVGDFGVSGTDPDSNTESKLYVKINRGSSPPTIKLLFERNGIVAQQSADIPLDNSKFYNGPFTTGSPNDFENVAGQVAYITYIKNVNATLTLAERHETTDPQTGDPLVEYRCEESVTIPLDGAQNIYFDRIHADPNASQINLNAADPSNPYFAYHLAGGGDSTSIYLDNIETTFELSASPPPFELRAQVSGGGNVSGGGINCGSGQEICSAEYSSTEPTSVTLTATPGTGYNFSGWGGDCSGAATTCNLTINGHKTVTASFTERISYQGIMTSGNGNHALAIGSDGYIYSWGNNAYGAVGNNLTSGNQLTPFKIPNLTNIAQTAVGGGHSLALTKDGLVYAWGRNDNGQVGSGNATSPQLTPTQVVGLSNVKQISAGIYFSMALTNDGSVYAWGQNTYGQVGTGNTTSPQTTPHKITSLSSVTQISAGCYHSVAISNGEVYSWGNNSSAQTGDGTSTTPKTSVTPKVTNLTGVNQASAGCYHTMALTNSGLLYTWGSNSTGQIGRGGTDATTKQTAPYYVPYNGAIKISAGGSHSLALYPNGIIRSWGYNASGQIGDNTTTNRFSPTLTQQIPPGITSILGASNSSFCLTSEGKIYGWGLNTWGQLGKGDTTQQLTPYVALSPP